MPIKPGRNCTRAGCAGIVRGGVCSVCGDLRRTPRQAHDRKRGSAAQRGYGVRWRKLRATQLAMEPLCRECLANGRTTAATDVDHIVARRDGGSDGYENLQSLCHSCHSSKTARGG